MIIEERSEFDSARPEKRKLPVLAVTSANRYKGCPRAYFYANVLKRRIRKKDENLRFGTLFHKGLEAWWLGRKNWSSSPDWWIRAAIAVVNADTGSDAYERVKANVLLHGYHTRWAAEEFEVLGVEVPFEGELRNPLTSGVSRTFLLGGKIDAIIRNPQGQVWLVEHKTSAEDISDGSLYWQRLTLDSQVSTYLAGARFLGHDPYGCLYDVIGKPAMKPLKATSLDQREYTKPTKKNPIPRLYARCRENDETAEEYGMRIMRHIAGDSEPGEAEEEAAPPRFEQYYRRAYIVRSADEERDAAFNMWGTAGQIRESISSGIFPRNEKSCEQYRRLCDYFPVCTRQTGIDDETRYIDRDQQHGE